MKHISTKSALPLALAAGLLGTAGWSTNSQACAAEPLITSVCVMAAPGRGTLYGYLLAQGQQLTVNQYQAVYSLIGNTYGGTANQNFNLPDLRGRVIVGVGINPLTGTNYRAGQAGGNESVTLKSTQVPVQAHTHQLATAAGGVTVTSGIGNLAVSMTGLTATTTIGTLAASTTMSGLSASTTLGNLAGTIDGTKLALNGSSGGTTSNSPSGGSLTSTSGVAAKIYSSAAPSTSMSLQAGSISGTVPVVFTGAPSTTVTGSPTTILSGSPATTISGSPSLTGAPSVTIGGQTGTVAAGGTGALPVSIMPPYLAMNYYFAMLGTYPTYD